MGLEEAICWTAHGKPSNDLLMWESAAGELLFRDRSGKVFELGEDREVPEEVARDRGRRRAAMLAIWNAMRDGKLKQQRRIATRYDKTVLSFESFLNLAAARLWLKSFVNAA
jgi:transposase